MSDAAGDGPREDWHTDFFDEDYARWGLAPLTDELEARFVTFLRDALRLEDGHVVFDQCCGVGRLSLPLASAGLRVIGVDITPAYVERARAAAATRALPCTFHCADAHDFVSPEPCHAAINWFTSFGYDRDDARNAQVIARAFESLRPGGRYVIDFQNVPRIFAEFLPSIVERPDVPGLEGLIVIQENRPDFLAGLMRSTWTIIDPDGRQRRKDVAVRMYLPHQIADMMTACGFTDIELLGSADGEPFSRRGRRCVIIGRRPG
ncbi:MAG: class I SAM-dependent methyltransferase [Planctomycetota bacterium]|jgi:SAM-dependent methyltransferase